MPSPYDFRQLGEATCKDIAKAIVPLLVGRRALNTSFDSGREADQANTPLTGWPLLPMVNGRPLELVALFSIGNPQAVAIVA